MTPTNEPTPYFRRQPLLDRDLEPWGYAFSSGDSTGDASSARVLVDLLAEQGLETVARNRTAFVSVAPDLITKGYAFVLPPEGWVISLSAAAARDPDVLPAVRRQVTNGYTFGIDGVTSMEDLGPLLEVVRFVTIDPSLLDRITLVNLMRRLGNYQVQLIAKPVDDYQQLWRYHFHGFDAYEGSFLASPDLINGRPIPVSRLGLLQLLSILDDPDASLARIAMQVSKDVSLSYKLLRIINSAAYGLPRKVVSIREAVVFLGIDQILRWAYLIALADIGVRSEELIVTALVRARMAELITDPRAGVRDSRQTSFAAGLLSVLPALTNTPMEEIVTDLPLSDSLVDALVRLEGCTGRVLGTVLAYERGDWAEVVARGAEPTQIAQSYLEAVNWSNEAAVELSTATSR